MYMPRGYALGQVDDGTDEVDDGLYDVFDQTGDESDIGYVEDDDLGDVTDLQDIPYTSTSAPSGPTTIAAGGSSFSSALSALVSAFTPKTTAAAQPASGVTSALGGLSPLVLLGALGLGAFLLSRRGRS